MENFNGQEKHDVFFEVGDPGYPVYVRARIVITWKEKTTGIVYFRPVEDTDYILALDLTDGWTSGSDGCYYYTKPVESGGHTTVLLKDCAQSPDAEPPEGYTLSVEILVQTIQAIGYTDDPSESPAWKDAGWKIQ